MEIFQKKQEILDKISTLRNSGLTIGFVPTMGALHFGHIALIKRAQIENDVVVVSIFVNPTQFNNKTDFEKYPHPIEKDKELLTNALCNILWLPDVNDIYPNDYRKHKNTQLELGNLGKVLEGNYRIGHFEGVLEVVSILFDNVQPTRAYFGKKDFQQLAIVQQLTKSCYPSVEIVSCETLREKNGLAMSSRNERLTVEGKEKAALIYETLNLIKNTLNSATDVEEIINKQIINLELNNFKIDYLAVVESNKLTNILKPEAQQNITICIATYLEEVRLIDNIQFIWKP